MGVVARLIGSSRQSLENPSTSLDSFFRLMAGAETKAGSRINEESALTISAVWRAVNVISSQVAIRPLHVYRRLGDDGKERQPQHPVARLLRNPNPLMPAAVFRETLQAHALTWGNGYAEIERDQGSRPVRLWPITPDRVSVMTMEDPRSVGRIEKWFMVRVPDGQHVRISADNMLHVQGLGWGGIAGRSVISLARERLGLTKAAEEFASYYFGQGSRASGVLQAPQGVKFSDDTVRQLKESWSEAHEGLQNSHRTIILQDGLEWKQVSIPPNDAQFLETREFQVTDVARWFSVPPHMLYDLRRATFSNIEHQSIEFDREILDWLIKWEQAIDASLFSEQEQPTMFAQFLVDAVLRADTATRGQFYQIMQSQGDMSPNEVRSRENMNPIEGGDRYFVRRDTWPLDRIDDLVDLTVNQATSETSIRRRETELWAAQMRHVESLHAELSTEREAREKRERGRAEQRVFARRKNAEPLFERDARSAVRRESDHVRGMVRRNVGSRDIADLKRELEEFYATFDDWVAERFKSVMAFYADRVADEVARDINGDIPPDLPDFVADYAAVFGTQWAASSRGQILELVEEFDPDALVAAVDQRLSEWEDRRPGKVSGRQTVELEGATTKAVFVASGVTVMRWRTTLLSCPLCQSMDGRTVGVEGAFVGKGGKVEAEGVSPLVSRQTITHPPLHRGCDCRIEPG